MNAIQASDVSAMLLPMDTVSELLKLVGFEMETATDEAGVQRHTMRHRDIPEMHIGVIVTEGKVCPALMTYSALMAVASVVQHESVQMAENATGAVEHLRRGLHKDLQERFRAVCGVYERRLNDNPPPQGTYILKIQSGK